MGMAFFYAPFGESQWRGPLGIALIWPVVMLIVIALPFVPESPRWLLMKEKIDKAEEVTLRLHRVKGDPDNEFARAEFYQMRKQAERDRELDPGWVRVDHSLPSHDRILTLCSGRCSDDHLIASGRSWLWALPSLDSRLQ